MINTEKLCQRKQSNN